MPAKSAAPGSDDFQALTGTKYSEGTLVDVLRYRIQRQRINNGSAPYDLTVPAQKLGFDAAHQPIGVSRVTRRSWSPGSGWTSTDHLAMAWITGQSRGCMACDDPLEAGEPFLDINGNGKRDDGTNGTPVEPFIDLDGNNAYLAPLDKLWQGLTSEPIEFDYTNGVAVPIYKGGIAGSVKLRFSRATAICTAALLLNAAICRQNYIAPWDQNDSQIMTWMAAEKKKLTAQHRPKCCPGGFYCEARKLLAA